MSGIDIPGNRWVFYIKKYKIAIMVVILTFVLMGLSFSRYNIPEAAYILFVPFIVWGIAGARLREYSWAAVIVSVIGWAGIICWLRYVTVVGWLLLSGVLGGFYIIWLLYVRWMLGDFEEYSVRGRIFLGISVAGMWSFIEWVRSWIFSGFPWMTLAVTQWERPMIAQYAAYGGMYLVSFVLILFNVGSAFYVYHIFLNREKKGCGTCFIVGDMGVAILFLFGGIFLYVDVSRKSTEYSELLRVGVVQPDIPAVLKWDADEATEQMEILEELTLKFRGESLDAIIWPESALPYPIFGINGYSEKWVSGLVKDIHIPLIAGTLIFAEDGNWYNAVIVVSESGKIDKKYYCKRKCVPFGEYVPFEWLKYIVNKVVPLGDDIVCGDSSEPMRVELGSKLLKMGVLICYEDIFPNLGIDTAKSEVDFFLVLTNDNWFGRESGAYQHAAHSVFRAIETRRPVVRCGNAGWSGWVDELGQVRHVMKNDEKSIYFRGVDQFSIQSNNLFKSAESFYVKYGNWFILLSAGWSIFSIVLRKQKKYF